MKIKILKATVVAGEQVETDSVVDAEARDARYLIACGYAVLHVEPEEKRKLKIEQK